MSGGFNGTCLNGVLIFRRAVHVVYRLNWLISRWMTPLTGLLGQNFFFFFLQVKKMKTKVQSMFLSS